MWKESENNLFMHKIFHICWRLWACADAIELVYTQLAFSLEQRKLFCYNSVKEFNQESDRMVQESFIERILKHSVGISMFRAQIKVIKFTVWLELFYSQLQSPSSTTFQMCISIHAIQNAFEWSTFCVC